MKLKIIIIIVFLLTFFVEKNAYSQQFIAGLSSGITGSQIEGDGYAGFNKFGVKFGGYVTSKLGKNLYGQFEINYVNKGSKKLPNAKIGDFTLRIIQLNYVEIPVLIKYKFKKLIYEGGFSFGKLLKQKFSSENGPYTSQDTYRQYEIALNLGINVPLNDRFMVDFRYSGSILPIKGSASANPASANYNGIFKGSYNTSLFLGIYFNLMKPTNE